MFIRIDIITNGVQDVEKNYVTKIDTYSMKVRLYDDRGKDKNFYYMEKIIFEDDLNLLIYVSLPWYDDDPEFADGIGPVLIDKLTGVVETSNLQFYYAENYYGRSDICWGSNDDRLRYEARTEQIEEHEDWIRSFDNEPEDGQSVMYTFPGMGDGVYTGEFSRSYCEMDERGNKIPYPNGEYERVFHGEHGALGGEDVYWKPWPPVEEA